MMGNAENIALHVPMLVIFGILLVVTIVRHRGKIRGDRSWLFLFCLVTWQLLEIGYFFIEDAFWAQYAFVLRLIPISFLPFAFFHFSVDFYRLHRRVPKWAYPVILGFPCVTALFCFLSPYLHFIFNELTATFEGTAVFIDYKFNFWYYIDLVFQDIVYVAIALVVISSFRILPSAYRRGSLFHILFIGCILVMQFFYLTSDATARVTVRFFFLSVAGLLFYLGNLLKTSSASSDIDQDSVFDYLDQAVFILNEDGVVVQTNRSAQQWLRSLRRTVENVTFDGLLSVLTNNKRIVVKKLEDSDDSDIHITGTAVPLIYRMERRPFTAGDGISKGEFIMLTDVTRNRLLIDRLRDMAGVDALTGLANRYRYQDLLRKLDRNENYPLAVVIGDVNGLKHVNDTFGHHMGDLYIKEIATVLRDCCPEKGYVARYGGDEFATLLVNCPQESVEEYIKSVDNAFKKPRDMIHQPSIAMGYAIKHHGNENLNALIAKADENMYLNKMEKKAAAAT